MGAGALVRWIAVGLSRSSSSSSSDDSSSVGAALFAFLVLAPAGWTWSLSLPVWLLLFCLWCPAAALVALVGPCRPVRLAAVFFGLAVIKPCKCVPRHGSSAFSCSVSLSALSALFGAFLIPSFSKPALTVSDRDSACFFFRVSSLIVVFISTGRVICLIASALRSLASFFRRTYSA